MKNNLNSLLNIPFIDSSLFVSDFSTLKRQFYSPFIKYDQSYEYNLVQMSKEIQNAADSTKRPFNISFNSKTSFSYKDLTSKMLTEILQFEIIDSNLICVFKEDKISYNENNSKILRPKKYPEFLPVIDDPLIHQTLSKYLSEFMHMNLKFDSYIADLFPKSSTLSQIGLSSDISNVLNIYDKIDSSTYFIDKFNSAHNKYLSESNLSSFVNSLKEIRIDGENKLKR